MSPLYKRIHVNTVTLWIKMGGDWLTAKKSLKTNLHTRSHTICTLNIWSTMIWSRLISRAASVEMVVALEEVHMPGNIWLVTSVVKRAISIKTTGQREMDLVVIHSRIPQTSFQNGWLRSLLYQIPNIWQQPPQPATTTSKIGAPLVILVRLHGYFNGRMAIRNVNLSKARSHLFVFPILPPMQ